MNTLTFILSASALLQLIAIVLAVRLVRISGRFVAWLVLASAFFVQFVRRSYTLYAFLSGSTNPPDLVGELLGLFISFLMVIGIAAITPVIRSLRTIDKKNSESEKNIALFLIIYRKAFRSSALTGNIYWLMMRLQGRAVKQGMGFWVTP